MELILAFSIGSFIYITSKTLISIAYGIGSGEIKLVTYDYLLFGIIALFLFLGHSGEGALGFAYWIVRRF